MRIAMALRFTAAEHRVLNGRLTARRRMFLRSLPIFAAAIAVCGLAGCGSDLIDAEHAQRISKERFALLKRQSAPRCEYRTVSLDDSSNRQTDGAPPANEANPDAVLRTKLDYERQCYKHAEMIARARLTSLQGAVQDSVKAAKRSNGNSSMP